MSQPGSAPDPRPGAHDGARARELLARKWAYLLSGAEVIPLSSADLDRELGEQVDALCEAITREPFDTAAVERVGEHVVSLGYVGEEGLRCTAEALGKGLPALPELQPPAAHADRVALAIGALATGFLVANRRTVFEQQERMQLSLLKAVRDAKWNLKESQARFDEVVTSSSSGIAIVALDGRLVRVNGAICDILDLTPAELADKALFDLVHPETVEMLRGAMRAVVEGGQDRVRQSQRLLRRNGDVARISLTASLLRDAEGAPGHFVVVVEDGTELVLLQSELNRQALHDVLTGLPNRQFFSSHLESAVRRADPVHGVTLLHLDLDAFGTVCDSFGWRTGERLLVHVAQRLRSLLALEKAMVARFDGDEFGILVENTATTPDIATITAAVNRELAEPLYVDDIGLAVSASIGVVRGTSRDQDHAELLRAADQALRRAKSGRRGQWMLFDPEQDAVDRSAHALALGMPGAWEQGEVEVRYRPVVRLADGAVAGAEAVLHWAKPGDPVPHERCVELAEGTGFILPLGEWLLATAAGQVRWWRQRAGSAPPLTIALTAHQASDADLVSRVVRVLEHTGLPADRLVVGVPVGAVAVPEAADNLGVLAEMGVRTALEDFALGPDDLAAARDFGVRAVRVARRLVDLRTRAGAGYATALVPVLRDAGIAVVVDGVATEEQAAWWRDVGADLATGPHFGPDDPADAFRSRSTP
ncbi:putative bifunctional diguanylate cyclase/phosphodiesterase [Saccharothrix longispora]|uniref:Diguanylate cyclase (GGDEF)-like protein/PAS domain S-box-containing protein n=1 Tax=Saccharothrix longispora TaxID=33920 RepID=A0ABU1PP20_9PSEU|nr:EAL domain-containing protein [Saccharothrix longispora]MDR6592427.1 diguanylate cyclase (GGDEF)-like protein/PAS domain S-box-containing protein [Saccharothrix longispora]